MGLMPGTYGVAETQPAGYLNGLDSAGTAGGTAHNPGDLISGVVLTPDLNAEDYDFGELLPALISGHVGIAVEGECGTNLTPPIAGVTMQLLDSTGSVIATTTTDANGNYVFGNLAPGTYGVHEIQPAGYFDVDTHAGTAGGDVSNNLVTAIVLQPSEQGLGYDFCEAPPVTIEGFVFQDGPPITVAHAGDVPDVKALRDGKLTPDDTLLPGVTLELRDGVTGAPILGSSALPGYYAPNQPITTVTDQNGHYEFDGLHSGTYAVFDVKPAGYLTGIDTPGSLGGVVVSSLFVTDPAVLAQLIDKPQYDALLGIQLASGEHAIDNNFSVVTTEIPPSPVQPFVIPQPPAGQPLPPPPAFFAAAIIPPGPIQYVFPFFVMPVVNWTGETVYTWHLSVVDAGQPRQLADGQSMAQLVSVRPDDELLWQEGDLDGGEWILGQASAGGDTAGARKMFGIRGGIPISGDFNGDGKFEVGVFKDGRWFIDLNDNGVWDAGDLWAKLGRHGDRPVTGDWDGDGKTDIGIYGPAWAHDPRALRHEPGMPDSHNTNIGTPKNIPRPPHQTPDGDRILRHTAEGKPRADVIDHVFFYGTPGEVPTVGDWNGDGTHTIAVFRNGVWRRDVDGDGRWTTADKRTVFGQAGDLPIVGDFNGDGVDDLGVYRNGTWYIDTNGNGAIDADDMVFQLGGKGDVPVVGDWNGDGKAEPGVYHETPAPSATDE
jgi:hypothetical protein